MAINTNLQVNNVLIQWPFLERVNETSNKYSFECVIPMDHPQANEIIEVCNNTWAQISGGSNNPQSMGYNIYQPGDLTRIAQGLHPLIDPAKGHLLFKGTQNADTQYPIKVYDSQSNEIPNVGIVGEGTVANVGVVVSGYDKPQKGVKMYGNWLQIIKLEVNKFTGGHVPAPIDGGYVADAEALKAPTQAAPAGQTYQAPTQAPMGTPAPTQAPMGTPAPTQAPMGTPAPTQAPMGTPAPAQAPMGTPAPTQAPMGTPAPAQAPMGTPAPVGQGAPTIPGIPG